MSSCRSESAENSDEELETQYVASLQEVGELLLEYIPAEHKDSIATSALSLTQQVYTEVGVSDFGRSELLWPLAKRPQLILSWATSSTMSEKMS